MGGNKLILILQTLRYIKPIQLYYQLYYRLRKKPNPPKSLRDFKPLAKLEFHPHMAVQQSLLGTNQFEFLNVKQKFDHIDWNYAEHGKLWTYNLNYFDFLNQEKTSKEQGLALILDFCSKSESHKDAYEPYPISLRSINWVKFLSLHAIQEEKIDQQLYHDLQRLADQLEYHILANHLFENGFGLLFGAYCFQDDGLYRIAKKIIRSQLKEQILPDGAHYELTPMYHQIILYRILDCYQLVSKNAWKSHELTVELKETASKMLGWLKNMQFSSGELPLVNDSTNNIAPTPAELYSYAEKLGISVNSMPLNESGYRFIRSENLELLMDVGQIAPSYQPGHSHADNLQILVYKAGKPYLVDTGISTYEKNSRRQLERSTSLHNTLTIDGRNSSEVWSGFRVGRRAKTKLREDNAIFIEASHDGYSYLGAIHQRSVELVAGGFAIKDTVFCKKRNKTITGNLHFHPDRQVQLEGNQVFVDGNLFLSFQGTCNASLAEYDYCFGYNQRSSATKITYKLDKVCQFIIHQ